MSVEDEKKPRKAPAKKKTSTASPVDAAVPAKVKAVAAPKPVPPKKKAPAKKVSEVPAPGANGEATVSRPRPTYAEISERAHGYFVARGRRHGHHEEDWLRAEQDLLSGL
ncbi:MAG TPA: DUF2934 domain-containing protein [Edaphobacter sp.]